MDNGLSKAYDLHADMAKQLINIATALVAAVIAFAKSGISSIELSFWPLIGLGTLLLSIALGILHLGALAAEAEENSSIKNSGSILWMARLQQLTFGLSVVVLVVTFSLATEKVETKNSEKPTVIYNVGQ